jgi:magnesium-transporting ATPase (P-type)
VLVIDSLQDEMLELFTVLALCHTVRVDKEMEAVHSSDDNTQQAYKYQSSSPDEKALVEACQR